MRNFLFLVVFISTLGHSQNANWVNVFIGTEGTGHTFPGPSAPFGMVQPGPDNKDYGWNHTSGYQYSDTFLMGFSQTRFSGTGINEMGDILVLPIHPKRQQFKNSYYKDSEKGNVGYYSVKKKDDVLVELSCSDRVAIHQYTFPEKNASVFLDFSHGLRFVFDANNPKKLVVNSNVNIENDSTISGFCSTQNWVNRTYYFTLSFDQPFTASTQVNEAEKSNAPRYLLDFKLNEKRVLKVKIALSTVSVEGAKKNLIAEMPHWDFNAVVKQNKQAWNEYLNRIEIEASSKQKELFYTALYHVLLQPSNIADVDGQYRGVDSIVSNAPFKAYYSTLSIWDIYRGAFPLLQIVAPEKIDGIVHSMLLHHKAKGFLPIWTAWGQDNYCMIGNHAIPMILSAYANGFRGFDAKDALTAMVETSTRSHINSDWELYNQFGYYPFDKLDNEAVSRSLESGYDDWCVAEMARQLANKEVEMQFTKRANYYLNLFDKQSGFFRGKDSKGNWRTPFDPLMATSPLNNPGDYTEANAWQYFWTPAQYDLSGLIDLLGGKEKFTQKLNEFFTTDSKNPNKYLGQEAMIGQYAHGNEPSHHVVYLYAYSNAPEIGQKYIHKVINEFHSTSPDGMIGNDDCGQMSAWYILSSLGFYPINPASGEFVFGSPQVKSATIHLSNGKHFTIKANGISETAIYSSVRKLNNELMTAPFIRYSSIMNGGSLEFEMKNP